MNAASFESPPLELVLGERFIEEFVNRDPVRQGPETSFANRVHRHKAHGRHMAAGNDHRVSFQGIGDQLRQVRLGGMHSALSHGF